MDGLVWFPRLPFPCFSFLCSSSSARSLVVFVSVHIPSARSIPCQENLLLGYAAIPGSTAENWRNTVPEVGAGPSPRGAWGVGAPLGPRLPRACGEWRPLTSAHRVWVETARDSRRTHAGATQVTGTSGAGRAGSWRPGCEPRPGPALTPFLCVFVAHVRPILPDRPVCREKLVRCLHFYIYILPFRNMIGEVFYYKRRIKGHIRTHSSNGWIRPPGSLVKHLCLCTPKSSTAT